MKMTNQEKENKYYEIMEKEEAMKSLSRSRTPEEAQHVFAQYGLDVSIDETNEIMSSMVDIAKRFEKPGDELSENELELVSGGSNWLALKKVAGWTWTVGTAAAGFYWGSQADAKKATVSFWRNVVTRGWNYAAANVHNY